MKWNYLVKLVLPANVEGNMRFDLNLSSKFEFEFEAQEHFGKICVVGDYVQIDKVFLKKHVLNFFNEKIMDWLIKQETNLFEVYSRKILGDGIIITLELH